MLLLSRNRASVCWWRHDGGIHHTLASRCVASTETSTPVGQDLPRRQIGQVHLDLILYCTAPVIGSWIGASHLSKSKKNCRLWADLLGWSHPCFQQGQCVSHLSITKKRKDKFWLTVWEVQSIITWPQTFGLLVAQYLIDRSMWWQRLLISLLPESKDKRKGQEQSL